ncbi:Uncharacterised protein [Kingella negevensis]|uniref:L,D-transpeptidase catalytic domain n=2 Tax=Kingella negevensis TaxID=1522312 RepID=A0A238TAF7_9NEIS|nr:Uncharacterised protein [Kingella negevensis]
MKRLKYALLLSLGLATMSGQALADDSQLPASVVQYMQSRRVVVDTSKAELCFPDTKDCHKVLIGKTTPKGTYRMTLHTTDKKGYGGDVIGFKEENGFLFALHRVWTQIPAEHRLQRIASDNVADRVMTNGCINVENAVYDRLKKYFYVDIV